MSAKFNLTPKRYELLQLAATSDGHGRNGIPAWAYRHMKSSSKRVVNAMLEHEWLTCDVYGNIITTAEGEAVYTAQRDHD